MKIGTALVLVAMIAAATTLILTGHGDVLGWAVVAVFFAIAVLFG